MTFYRWLKQFDGRKFDQAPGELGLSGRDAETFVNRDMMVKVAVMKKLEDQAPISIKKMLDSEIVRHWNLVRRSVLCGVFSACKEYAH